jgi:hypothetical protein
MSSDCSPVAAFSIFAFGGLLLGFYFVMLRNRREAENLPTSTCRAVPMGLVEVTGTVSGTPFASPFGSIPCVCSTLIVEEWRKDSKADHWHEIYGRSFSTPFYVEDSTGRVRVDPDEADLQLQPDFSCDVVHGLVADAKALERLGAAGLDEQGVRQRLQQFGERRGSGLVDDATLACAHREPQARGDLTSQVFARGLLAARAFQDLPHRMRDRNPRVPRGTRPLRMREDNLCPGDKVYVLGTARPSDEAAGNAADRIVIGRGDLHPWFAIGESSQKETLLRMMRRAWIVAAAGAILMLMGVGMLADCLAAS